MKRIKLITSNKILIMTLLLTFIAPAVYAKPYSPSADKETNPETAQSTPTPTEKTADKQIVAARENTQSAGKLTETTKAAANTAKVVLKVASMSCAGCISTIKSSLAGYEGIQDIIVDIFMGTVEIHYDNRKIKDVNRLASSISASGYPATVSKIIIPDQLQEEEAAASKRAKFYIAAVNDWDISRADFDTEVSYAKNRYIKAYGPDVFSDERGKNILDKIRAQVVSRLINEGIQMQEIQRVGYRVAPKVMKREFNDFIKQKNIEPEALKSSLAESGYSFDYYMKKFENRVLLRNYIEDEIHKGITSDYDKQQQYLTWFNNAKGLSKVTIYDKQLERLTKNQSAGGGCGSSCQN